MRLSGGRQINGGVETISINLEDDADVKAQDFALAHNINIVHERRIAEQIRIRQVLWSVASKPRYIRPCTQMRLLRLATAVHGARDGAQAGRRGAQLGE